GVGARLGRSGRKKQRQGKKRREKKAEVPRRYAHDLPSRERLCGPVKVEPEGQRRIVGWIKQRGKCQGAVFLGQEVNHIQDRRAPERAEGIHRCAKARAAARVDELDRHKDQNRQKNDREGVHPGRGFKYIEIKHNDVPVGRETEKKVVRGLGVHAAKAVGAGEERQRGEPERVVGRQNLGVNQKKAGSDDEVEIIDDLIEQV